jgi:ABC-type glycerol-3-phosphate transport system substrate-binding protein
LGIYDAIGMFHNGKVATGYGGPYEINRIQRYALEGTIKSFDTRILPNPYVPAVGPVAYLTTSGFIVFKQEDTEKKRLVMELARELTSTETLQMLESLYYVSARQSANKLMYKNMPQIANEIDNYLEFISHGVAFFGPPTLILGDMGKYLQSMWEAVFSRTKTPAVAADEFVRNANRIVFKK